MDDHEDEITVSYVIADTVTSDQTITGFEHLGSYSLYESLDDTGRLKTVRLLFRDEGLTLNLHTEDDGLEASIEVWDGEITRVPIFGGEKPTDRALSESELTHAKNTIGDLLNRLKQVPSQRR